MGTVTHTFVSGISDGADATLVRPSNWNANHSLTGIDPHSAYLTTLTIADGGFILQLARAVLVSTDRLALQGTARLVDFGSTDQVVPNTVGVPRIPTVPTRLPDGYEARITNRYTLRGTIRTTIEGNGEFEIFDDFGTSRVVLTGTG